MGGLQRSDLIIIAARPAMGKTALATNIAFHVANHFAPETAPDGTVLAKDGGRVAFFSLEMSSEQLAMRILSEQANIPSSALRRGEIRDEQFSTLVDASARMSNIPLYIDDTGGISIAQLVSRARRLKRQRGLDMIVVDYLQLLSAPGRRGDGRVQEVTEITTGLKALAKELDIPVIALSQLSRQVEAREDKHPQLADLRESGSIEQDADVVMFVYREEYYLANAEPKEGTSEHLAWQEKMATARGRAELIIGKQRHGPTGTVQLHFDSNLTKFTNMARGSYLPERTE
jgi:replicative DNA helicase